MELEWWCNDCKKVVDIKTDKEQGATEFLGVTLGYECTFTTCGSCGGDDIFKTEIRSCFPCEKELPEEDINSLDEGYFCNQCMKREGIDE